MFPKGLLYPFTDFMSKTASHCPFLPLRADTPKENMAEAVEEPPFQPPRIRIILDEWFLQAAGISRGFTERAASICSLCTGHHAGSGVLMEGGSAGSTSALTSPLQCLGPTGTLRPPLATAPPEGRAARSAKQTLGTARISWTGWRAGPSPEAGEEKAGHRMRWPGVRILRTRPRSARAAAAADPPGPPPPPGPGNGRNLPTPAPRPPPAGAAGRSRPPVIRDAPRGAARLGGREGVGLEKGGRDRGRGGEGGGKAGARAGRSGARRGGPGPGRESRGLPQPRREGAKSGGRIKGTRGVQGGTGKGAAPGWRERNG